MSKYDKLWEYVKTQNKNNLILSFEEVENIIGFEIDHSFLTYKKELDGFSVKISLKKNEVNFVKEIESDKIMKPFNKALDEIRRNKR